MSDLIDRQAAIEALERLKKDISGDYTNFDPLVMAGTAYIGDCIGELLDLPRAVASDTTTALTAEREWGRQMRLIDADAAIDAIAKIEIKNVEEKHAKGIAIGLLSAIDELERLPAVNRWIPVTERLPEDIRPVLVTWKNNDPASYYQYIVGKHFIGTAHYHRGKWYWYSSVTEDLLAEYGKCDSEEFDEAIEPVAWMQLPEPWEEEEEKEKIKQAMLIQHRAVL